MTLLDVSIILFLSGGPFVWLLFEELFKEP